MLLPSEVVLRPRKELSTPGGGRWGQKGLPCVGVTVRLPLHFRKTFLWARVKQLRDRAGSCGHGAGQGPELLLLPLGVSRSRLAAPPSQASQKGGRLCCAGSFSVADTNRDQVLAGPVCEQDFKWSVFDVGLRTCFVFGKIKALLSNFSSVPS